MAVITKGDGNCLFNSLSLAIHNIEVLATELRYRTCLDMILNRDYYIDVHCESDLRFVSGSFDDSLIDCANYYSFSTAYTIHAASTAIGNTIRSFYPGVNGICDNSIGISNRTFKQRSSKKNSIPLCILWSSVSSFTGNSIWTPNYFVLLLKEASFIKMSVLDISDEAEFPLLSASPKKSNTPLTKASSFNSSLEAG